MKHTSSLLCLLCTCISNSVFCVMLNRPFFVFLSFLFWSLQCLFVFIYGIFKLFYQRPKYCRRLHFVFFVFFFFFLQKYLNSQVKLLRNYFTLFCIASSVSPCLVNNVIVILTPLNSSKNTCVFTEF